MKAGVAGTRNAQRGTKGDTWRRFGIQKVEYWRQIKDVHNGLREKGDEEGVGGRIRAYAEACDCDERQCQWQWNIMKLDILGEAEPETKKENGGR